MKRFKIHTFLMFILIAGSSQMLYSENILSILEGYGRDSISTFSTQNAQAEAARLFNLILEANGEVTTDKAEDYLKSSKSNIVRAYLSVMLADYAFINHNDDVGLRYMKRAVDDHDPIRNDSYYRLVLSRAQKNIQESPGKTDDHKTSVLTPLNPKAIKIEPEIKTVETPPVQTSEKLPVPDKQASPTPEVPAALPVNFRIQVGAFSVQENALKKQSWFEERGYPVHIDKRERTSGYLFIVRVGEYSTYNDAKIALSELKGKFPGEDGIVVKVGK